jgi:hypothetical protein
VVDRLDPDYLEELTVRLAAEADEAKAKRRRKGRPKGQRSAGLGRGWELVDVDVAEIT